MTGRPGRRHYGIAEVADALGVNRQLVTVWRRRRSRGMPEPDDELASGPLWLASTIEPWIEATRVRLELEASTSGDGLTPELVRKALRRFLRLAALLLEDRLRASYVARAARDLGELAPRLELAAAADEAAATALADLLGVARRAENAAGALSGGEEEVVDDMRRDVLRAVPRLAAAIERTDVTD